jgi:hypothetical protein
MDGPWLEEASAVEPPVGASVCWPAQIFVRNVSPGAQLMMCDCWPHPLSTYQRSKPKGSPALGRKAPVVRMPPGLLLIGDDRRDIRHAISPTWTGLYVF